MKYRTDFVTNSSSSSFVIALKDSSEEVDKILLEWARKQLMEDSEKINSIEQLDAYFSSRYCSYSKITLEELLEEEPDTNEEYTKCKNAILDGKVIICKSISCEGQDEHLFMFEELLEMLSESSGYEGIKTDLGY